MKTTILFLQLFSILAFQLLPAEPATPFGSGTITRSSDGTTAITTRFGNGTRTVVTRPGKPTRSYTTSRFGYQPQTSSAQSARSRSNTGSKAITHAPSTASKSSPISPRSTR